MFAYEFTAIELASAILNGKIRTKVTSNTPLNDGELYHIIIKKAPSDKEKLPKVRKHQTAFDFIIPFIQPILLKESFLLKRNSCIRLSHHVREGILQTMMEKMKKEGIEKGLNDYGGFLGLIQLTNLPSYQMIQILDEVFPSEQVLKFAYHSYENNPMMSKGDKKYIFFDRNTMLVNFACESNGTQDIFAKMTWYTFKLVLTEVYKDIYFPNGFQQNTVTYRCACGQRHYTAKEMALYSESLRICPICGTRVELREKQ